MRPRHAALGTLVATLLAVAAIVEPTRASPAVPAKTLMAASCGAISQNNWTIGLAAHESGKGLKLDNVKYKGVQVAYQVSTPLVLVQYAGDDTVTDDLTDGVFQAGLGCQKTNIGATAFRIWTTYIFGSYPSCPAYKYEDTYEFYADGGFYHYVKTFGPGYCNRTLLWYSPMFRTDYDISVSANYLDEWTASGWTNRTVEGNYYYQSPYYLSKWDWRTYTPGKQVTEAPAFSASSPDHWILRWHSNSELDGADGAMPPLSTWANGESINNADTVNWFVPYTVPNPELCQPDYPCKIGFDALLSGY